MIKRFFILLLAIVASVGMSFAQASIVSSGTKGGMSYTFYDNGLLEISGSGALPGSAFTNWDGGFGTSVKNIRFAEDCEVYGLDYMWFACYTENSQLETVEINSVAPIMFSGTSGAGIFYRQDGAVTLTITAPGIVDAENQIIDNYGSPVNMIFNMPATTVFERKWFSGLENNFAVTIPTGAKGHIPAGYSFTDPYDQKDYDDMVAHGHEDLFWESHSHLVEGVDYTLGVESTFVITAENASQIFGKATVSFQAPTEASNSEWVLWRKSDLKTFSDMSSGDQKVYKDVTVKVNNGVYNTNSGFGVHFESLAEDGVQFVAPEGKVFKHIVILNEYGTFSDSNWSYGSNYKRWSGSANTVGFVGDICGISLIEFELGDSAPAPATTVTWNSSNISDLIVFSISESYSKEGVTLSGNADKIEAYWYGSDENNSGISFHANATGGFTFSNTLGKNFTKIEMTLNVLGGWNYANLGSGWNIDGMKAIWTGNASTVDLLKDESGFNSTPVNSIVFYFEGDGGASADVIPCTAADLGKVLCTDGSIYATVSEASAANKTAAAVIAYVDTENGKALALALADDGGAMLWETAKTTAPAHTPAVSGGTWTLASKDDWDNMITAAGGYEALRDGFSAVGGTNMKNVGYWSSTSFMHYAWCYKFNNGEWFDDYQDGENYVRACLTFDIPAAPAYETVINLINAIGTVELTAECKAKIDAARAAYDALSDGDKDLVTNITTLTTAEAAFENVMNIWLSGDCDVILWKDTTLTVRKHAGEGNGAMADYNYASRAPWYSGHWYNPQPNDIVIKSVTIEEGVTHLGDYAFAWMSEMKTVTIPASVTTIPEDAFYWSKAVDDIYLTVADPSNLTWVLPNTADVQFKPEKATLCHVPVDLLPFYQEWLNTINVTYVGDQTPTIPTLEVGLTLNAMDVFYLGPDTTCFQFNCFSSNKYFFGKGSFRINFESPAENVHTMHFVPKQQGKDVMMMYRDGETFVTYGTNCCATALPTSATVTAGDGTKANPFVLEPDTKGECVQAEWTTLPQAVSEITYDGEPHTLVAAGVSTAGKVQYSLDNGASWSADLPQGTDPVTYTVHYRVVNGGNACIQGIDYDPNNKVTASIVAPAVENVEAKIAAIPSPVVYTPACKDAIDAARSAYDALDDDLKPFVENYDVLTTAEATYANLKDVVVVEAKINELPNPMTEADLKLSIYNKVTDARAAYDALTADQKPLVSNLAVLEAAEAAFDAIGGGGGGPAYSINASGDVVVFAPGNLQATLASSTWTWSFAANQWDIIGNAAANTSVNGNGTLSADGTVDLFGWVGNSSTVLTDGMAQNGISNSQTAEDYGNVAVEALKSDWSTFANANSLGGRTDWRLLTNDEWAYIINTRSATYRYCKATVNNVIGLVIFPDGYTHPSGLAAIQEANEPKGAYASNVWTAEDWALMATAGATFLPAGGNRVGANVYNTTNTGRYWTSASHPQSAASAYGIEFSYLGSTSGNVRVYGLPRYYGASIRLAAPAVVSAIAQAQAAVALINAIPSPVTLDSKDAIEAARAAVDALGENAKLIDAADLAKLTQAEADYAALIQAGADAVKAKIAAIPQPVTLKLATRDSINNARAAYDALNAAQQALVSNYQTLLDAEAALAEKNPGVPPATPLDSAQAVKDLIDAIPTPVEYPTSGPAIAAALNAYDALSDAAKGALDAADVQKLNDAATQYPALEAIAAIEAIPAEIVYDPAVKAAIETAREKYNALSDASKELVDDEVVAKLTNAEEAWAILVAKIEHNVTYIGKDGELKNEKVALLHIPDPAPDFNGYEFVRWDVKGGDFLEEGLRIKAVYTPIITTNPQGFDTLAYNGLAQELVKAGVAKEGHIEYSLYPEEPESWSAELPKATFAGVYAIYYKLVREGHADYIAPEPTMATIAKVPVTYTAPTAVEALVYNASNQTLIAAGQTQDGTFEYSLAPTLLDSWKAELPQAKDAGTYSVYYRVLGDLNHLDSTAVDPIAVTIAKAPLTATADDKSIIYGDLAPEFTVTYAGWQGTEGASVLTGEIAYACEYVKGHPVGEYVITPSGVDANNYTIEFVKGKLTVNSKSAKSDDITAKQADNEMLVYDAAANKPTIQAKDTTKTLVEDTDYKLTFIGRGETEYAESATAPAHVGEYTAIVAFIGNYTDTLTVDFVINKAPLTITADDKEVTFGEFAPEFTVSYEGWQGEDTATVLTGSQAYACEYVRGNQIGDYTIIPSGVDAHDYAITFVNGTLTVNRKSAKSADITAKQADNEKLVYDAEANRPTIQVKDTTLVLTEAQDYVLTFMGVAADQTPYAESETAPTHVGNYKAIVAFIGNYIDTLTVDFTINKAPLTITANDTAMIYGDEHPEFTVSYNGWFGNDDESVILGTQAYDCVYAPGSPIGTYVITPKDVDAYDYAITFVDGTLTVNKAHVYVSDAEAQIAKFADGHANAVVLEQGILNGIKLNDPIAHVTTAAFSSADVAEHLTITLSYELTGDAALLNNYNLDPTSDIFTNEGVIIEPFIPDNEEKPEDKEATVNEGIEIYAYGYCDGSGYSLKYHLESGNPDQYKIDFADSRFTDVDWTNLVITGKDGTIDIEIPVDMPTGDYTMTVYFRDSRFDWLESRQFNVTFHVNLPETYVRPLFDNVIALVDTCECLTDIQWYWRANSTDLWQPIEGANGYYYHVDGKLTGEYFVAAKMNGEPTFTCGQADMETLYGADQQAEAPVVRAYPNPVVNSTTVTIENSIEWIHNIRIVNLMGAEVMNATFEGNETSVEMGNYPQGNYMISVDGIVVKVMKK